MKLLIIFNLQMEKTKLNQVQEAIVVLGSVHIKSHFRINCINYYLDNILINGTNRNVSKKTIIRLH